MKKIYMRFPGFRDRALTLSYDDAKEQDKPFIEILDRYGVKCTFNVNSGTLLDEPVVYPPGTIHRVMTREAAVALYSGTKHEVAVHTVTHPHTRNLAPVSAVREIYEDRKALEALFGVEVRGMAYPFGAYDDSVVEVAKNCGIAYARTTQQTLRFDIPSDWLRMPSTCHHNNPKLMELAEKFVTQTVPWEPLLFYVWGHSYEFEADDNWHVIEDFCKKVGGRENVWYATNIEIYDYVEAYRALRFSADGLTVFNPTCIPVCFEVAKEGSKYTVHPGEYVRI